MLSALDQGTQPSPDPSLQQKLDKSQQDYDTLSVKFHSMHQELAMSLQKNLQVV
jgi:hypothetical protein